MRKGKSDSCSSWIFAWFGHSCRLCQDRRTAPAGSGSRRPQSVTEPGWFVFNIKHAMSALAPATRASLSVRLQCRGQVPGLGDPFGLGYSGLEIPWTIQFVGSQSQTRLASHYNAPHLSGRFGLGYWLFSLHCINPRRRSWFLAPFYMEGHLSSWFSPSCRPCSEESSHGARTFLWVKLTRVVPACFASRRYC